MVMMSTPQNARFVPRASNLYLDTPWLHPCNRAEIWWSMVMLCFSEVKGEEPELVWRACALPKFEANQGLAGTYFLTRSHFRTHRIAKLFEELKKDSKSQNMSKHFLHFVLCQDSIGGGKGPKHISSQLLMQPLLMAVLSLKWAVCTHTHTLGEHYEVRKTANKNDRQ